MKFTVFGSRGFIGSHLVRMLNARGNDCLTPDRGEIPKDLGHAIWAIGLTADFRQRPIDTVRAHVAAVLDVLEHGGFDSFLYLSSTRIYAGAATGSEETTFNVDPVNGSDLYNISKLMGESVCHASGRANVRVARLSNVFGADFGSSNFLSSIIRDAVQEREIVFSTAADSAKDYVSIDDVASMLIEIATKGHHNVYNIASGMQTANADIARTLQELTGCRIRFDAGAQALVFPSISISRLQQEFEFKPERLLDALPALVQSFGSVSAT